MRADIHSHTAPAKYLEAIRRDPRSMGCRVEKDDQGRESVVQDNGRSTRVRTNLIEPELRLREMAAGASRRHRRVAIAAALAAVGADGGRRARLPGSQ